MDPVPWRLFLEAVDLGSFGKVALARGTSQPQVSRQMADLEAHVGERLFFRTGRGVALTAFGQRIAPQVRAWLASTAQLESEILSAAATPIGRVRLGILPSLACPFASRLFAQSSSRYPQIELTIREGQGAQLETWLDDGGLDLALMFRHGPAVDRDALALTNTQTYLVGSATDRHVCRSTVRFADLQGLPLVMFCRPSRWRDWLEQIAREQGVALNVVLEADSLSLQMAIAAEGRAYALLGAFTIAEGLSAGRLQAARVVEPELPRHIAMALPKTGLLTPAVRAVMELVRTLASDMKAGT